MSANGSWRSGIGLPGCLGSCRMIVHLIFLWKSQWIENGQGQVRKSDRYRGTVWFSRVSTSHSTRYRSFQMSRKIVVCTFCYCDRRHLTIAVVVFMFYFILLLWFLLHSLKPEPYIASISWLLSLDYSGKCDQPVAVGMKQHCWP